MDKKKPHSNTILIQRILVVCAVIASTGERVQLPYHHDIKGILDVVCDYSRKVRSVCRFCRERPVNIGTK